ncbi:hypothetical protein UFOVP231_38 [uncultured Caudovirales phage]|uniref:Uncharacterized protein n=1 Tax=uncultured Caudovirales phage TaxID=2100421 RepID=A0A6J7WQN2_9CAUD|nr:hypothetical protein UFOVP231_38 [uncultured Caudovirales phage]
MPHGALKLIPGVDVNKTPALNEAAISQSQLIRFIPDRTIGGLVQKLGGWSKFYLASFSTVIRNLWAWEDTNSRSYLAVGAEGTASGGALQIISSGSVNDRTPETSTYDVVVNLSTTAGSNAVIVTDTGRYATSYDSVYIQTPISVGGIIIYGQYQCYNPGASANTYTIYAINAAGAPDNASFTTTASPITITGASGTGSVATLTYSGSYVFPVGSTITVSGMIPTGYNGTFVVTVSSAGSVSYASTATGALSTAGTISNNGAVASFATTIYSATVNVTLSDHGYVVGDTFPVIVPVSVGGVTVYGNYIVNTVLSSSVFTITTTEATSTATVFQNSGLAHYVYYRGLGPLPAGTGYGIGPYGIGGYGTGVAPPAPTPGTPITATDWTLDNWGEILIACPLNGPIYAWSPTNGQRIAVVIPQAPAVNAGAFVAMPQRQIVAWGSTSNGIQDPLLIRWCDVENFTQWVGTITNQAGSYRIPKGSKIIQCLQAGQQALIWTDLGIWAMQYVGPPYVYQFNELANGCGIIGRRAAAAVAGTVYWMGPNQFYRLSGNGVEPVRCPVWDVVFQDLDTSNLDSIRVAVNSRFGEIAWHYPTNGTKNITSIAGNGSSVTVTFSDVGTVVRGSTITISNANPTTYNGSYVVTDSSSGSATFVSTNTALYVSGGTLSASFENNAYIKYNFVLDQWDYGVNTTANPYVARSAWINESVLGPPIGAGLDKFIFQHETSPDADGSGMHSYFQTGYFVLSEADVKMFIDQVWPDMKWGYYGGYQSANIQLTFYVVDYPGQTPTAYGPYPLTQATTYITPRFRGRLVSIRIEGSNTGSWWRLGNFRYRIQQDGKY